MRANSYTEAAEAFESAREISPFDPRLDALVARAHLVGGDVDQAAASVLRGLRKDNAQRDCLTILSQLKTSSPTSVTTSAVGLEIDQEAVEQKEPFIYVPPWTHGTRTA
jgi:predicted Zn-dependent protease